MASLTVTADHAGAAGKTRRRGRTRVRAARLAVADRTALVPAPVRSLRSWPLLVLAVPAAAEVWSGWAGIARTTGFGLVSPLPGIWPALHLDTAITLPVGVEAYAAYALRAWLAREQTISGRTRRFAKWPAISSFALGMAGQVAFHLMTQAGMTRAPWAVTTIVSCLPVLVLAMGTTLAHMLRADFADRTDRETGPACGPRTGKPDRSTREGPRSGQRGLRAARDNPDAGPWLNHAQLNQGRTLARRLAADGMPVTRRALRAGGVRGSNQVLSALAGLLRAELSGAPAAGDAGEPP